MISSYFANVPRALLINFSFSCVGDVDKFEHASQVLFWLCVLISLLVQISLSNTCKMVSILNHRFGRWFLGDFARVNTYHCHFIYLT